MAARAAALLITLAALCFSTTWQPTSASTPHVHRHSLGATPEKHPQEAMHIVIAMYQEDINEVQQYVSQLLSIHSIASSRPRIFLYVKGGPEMTAQALQAGFAQQTIELPNIGREQETYLRHVVTHYDHLPAHVLFTQALANYEDLMLDRLNTLFSARTGLMGLGLNAVCTCEGHSQIWPDYQAGGFIRLREVWAIAQGTLCPHEFACFHNGFIMASRARLRLQPRKKWEYLLSLFMTGEDDPLRRNEMLYQHFESSIPEGWPTWGHVMERSWNALLNCTDPDVAYRCGEPACEEADCTGLEQCQCLDPVLSDRLAPI
ncbi:hypothetical protein COCOBI_08-6110 [Coccomyxa sp. Obi]|nr:hypothetical protein COCOBI_08-6110 [Coccomyxa sp. Obi]